MRMNKSIKIIILAITLLSVAISTKSYAAVEAKGEDPINSAKKQIDAYQICYDMRNPTSSLGNNNLDPHLSLSKDYSAWVYLGLSAYGTNGKKKKIDNNYWTTTVNKTGVMNRNARSSKEILATVIDPNNTSNIINKYGRTKYLEVLDTKNFNNNDTKGMALTEILGWYSTSTSISDDSEGFPAVITRESTDDWYGYNFKKEDISDRFVRPIIWNKK